MKMKLYFLLAFSMICMTVNAQDSTYKELTGRYKFPAGSVIDEAIVTWENGVLNMNSSAGTSTLERIKGDSFNVVSFNGVCIFKRDDSKKVNGVHVDAGGYLLDGVKDTTSATIAVTDSTEKPEIVANLIRESIADRYLRRIHVIGCIVP